MLGYHRAPVPANLTSIPATSRMPQQPKTRPDPIAALRQPGFLLFSIGACCRTPATRCGRWRSAGKCITARASRSAWDYVGPGAGAAGDPARAAGRRGGRSLFAADDDHARRRRGLAASGLGLAWASWSHAPLGWVYFFLLGTGTFRALGWPAATAIVAGLVPQASVSQRRDVAERGVSNWRPRSDRCWADSCSPWWSPVTVYLDRCGVERDLDRLPDVREARAASPRIAEPKSWRSLVEGIRFLRRQPIILSTMTLDMVAVLFGGATALLPIYATDVLHVGATGFGWLRAMPSIGAICMGLLLAALPPMRHGGRTLLWAVVGVRRGDDRVRAVDVVSAVAGGAVHAWARPTTSRS